MLYDTLKQEWIQSMKDKDKQKKEVLSLVLDRIKKIEKEKEIELRKAGKAVVPLTEEEMLQAVHVEVKQIKETIRTTPSERTDVLEANAYRLKILESYLPKQMSKIEIKNEIDNVLFKLGIEKPAKSDRGRIMKELMPTVKGKADGQFVSQLLESLINA